MLVYKAAAIVLALNKHCVIARVVHHRPRCPGRAAGKRHPFSPPCSWNPPAQGLFSLHSGAAVPALARSLGVPGRWARCWEADAASGLGAERWFDSGDSSDYAANSLLRLWNGDSNAIPSPAVSFNISRLVRHLILCKWETDQLCLR